MTQQNKEKLISLDGRSLTLEQVEAVVRHNTKAELASHARSQLIDSAEIILRLAESDTPVYGVNTGFGIFANQRIEPEQSKRLSRNLALSHAVGLGPPFEREIVRAAMLIRANTLARGHSGVRPEIIDTLLCMLERDVTPFIPSKGSLGSSGDLAPLAHLALVLSAALDDDEQDISGSAWLGDKLMSGAEAMAAAGIDRITLGPKEGLAIVNGATFSAAILALACLDAERILLTAELAAAISLEALMGVSAAFDPRLHEARPHPGQISVARRLRALINGSELLDSNGRVQDAYSLRCTPQIVGPAWDILSFAKSTASIEINSATDNPLLFGEQALSGGNFHGEPIGLAADYLKLALTKVGAISERRTFRLTAEHTNFGLPPMLVTRSEEAGLYSGLMMLQYTAASLTLENQALATPDNLPSIPTSAGQEDQNANATTATRHLTEVISNLSRILAIELIAAAQALDLRLQLIPQAKVGVGTTAVHTWIREYVPFRTEDYPHAADIETVADLVRSGDLANYVYLTLPEKAERID